MAVRLGTSTIYLGSGGSSWELALDLKSVFLRMRCNNVRSGQLSLVWSELSQEIFKVNPATQAFSSLFTVPAIP